VALMGIGEFARLSRVSAKALRRYDELGLLRPSRVDPGSGYRWYSAGQLDQARLVATLRQIGVPPAQIKMIVDLEPAAGAEQIDAYWAGAEADHAARRELACYLVDRLNGKRSVMYEVSVREVPARSLLSLLRYVHHEEFPAVARDFFGRFASASVPRLAGIGGAPFMVYHGEVSEDSDGPGRVVQAGARRCRRRACRPVPRPHSAHRARARGGLRPPGQGHGASPRGSVPDRLRDPARLGGRAAQAAERGCPPDHRRQA
jgi:DNA-binding transcriptional MerR regulator